MATFEVQFSPSQTRYIRALLDSGNWGLSEAEVVRNLIRIGIKRLIETDQIAAMTDDEKEQNDG